MKVTLYSTEQIVALNGIDARIWVGTTDSGIPVHAFITRIAVDEQADHSQFEAELQVCLPPRPECQVYPARLLL